MRTVGDLTRAKEFYSVTSDQSVYDAALYMADKDIGAVPVLQDNRFVGIFSERDVMRRVIVPGLDSRKTLLGDVMTRDVVVATEDETIAEVRAKMQINRVRHMPVIKGDHVVGFLSLRDLLFADAEDKHQQVQELQTYLYYSPEKPGR
jgi:CBS domain-containing protein